MTGKKDFEAASYEEQYKEGYGIVYPESHIIRVHKHILEWELGITNGSVLDFGCGTGAHLKYFADHGFTPYGCDTSKTAIEHCRALLPQFKDNFHATPVYPNLAEIFPRDHIDVFLSNQVLYYLEDSHIQDVVHQVFELLRPGGVFIATMIANSHWFSRYVAGNEGDFSKVELNTPRLQRTTLVNFKSKGELETLFAPFKKLHLGIYGAHVREEEGPTDHWLFVGVRE